VRWCGAVGNPHDVVCTGGLLCVVTGPLYSLETRAKVLDHSGLSREDLAIFSSQTLNSTFLCLQKMVENRFNRFFLLMDLHASLMKLK